MQMYQNGLDFDELFCAQTSLFSPGVKFPPVKAGVKRMTTTRLRQGS